MFFDGLRVKHNTASPVTAHFSRKTVKFREITVEANGK
jgi:hypothetical protein